MPGRLDGRVAFITGAARGQGRSHAIRFAEEGADIIAIDVCKDLGMTSYPLATPEEFAETARRVESLDRRIITAEVDVRDLRAMREFVDSAVGELGRLDVVVANAGIDIIDEPLHEIDEIPWSNMMDVNLTGVWKTVKASVGHILAGGRGGSVVLTSSVAGLKPHANIGHYVAAKHGVVGIMRSLALELGPHGIRVNSVHPSQVNTPLMLNESIYRLFRPDLDDPGPDDIAPISQQMHVLPIPWVEPEDISNAALFLACDESRYVTGVTLPVDAGCCLK